MTTLSGVLTMDMASAKSTETKVTTPSMELTITACKGIITRSVVPVKTTSTIGGGIRTSQTGMTTPPTMAKLTSLSSVIMDMDQQVMNTGQLSKPLERNVLIELHIKIMSSGATTMLSLEESVVLAIMLTISWATGMTLLPWVKISITSMEQVVKATTLCIRTRIFPVRA